MSDNLKAEALKGAVWSFVQRFGVMLVAFVTNMVLARLLTPADFGCIGMLYIFIAIAQTMIDGGFVSALIQKKDLSREDCSTVFWWNLAISALMYLLLWFASPYIAIYYKIPLLSQVLRVQGILLFFYAVSSVQITLVRRNMQFKKYAIIYLIANLCGAIIGIVLAFMGFGVWSIVIYQLCSALIVSILFWIKSDWYPIFFVSSNSFKSLFSYGSFILFSNLLNVLSNNIQGLIIGRRFSAYDMGCYTQAKKLEELPSTTFSSVIGQVIFPMFAKVQDDKARISSAHRLSIQFISFVTFPIIALLFVIASPLINLLYGEQWVDAIPLFRILCFAGLFVSLQDVNYYIVAAVGKSKLLFNYNIIKRLVGISLICIGMFWGINGVMVGMVLNSLFIFMVNAVIASKYSTYKINEQIKDIVAAIVTPVIVAVIVSFMVAKITFRFDVYELLFGLIAFLFLFVALQLIFCRERVKVYCMFCKSILRK